MRSTVTAIIVLAFNLATPSVQAETLTDRQVFVLGNIEFVLLHELAHLLIEDLQLPIIGPEEHAADYIAALALIRPERFGEPRAERARRFASAAAQGFAGAWRVGQPTINTLPYWDDHALTIQRFYQISCLLYGANPERFPKLPKLIGMPDGRAKKCSTEFERADRGVEWLFTNYGRNDAERQKAPIYFSQPDTRAGQETVAAMAETQLIENAVSRLQSRFALKAPIAINIQACGLVQAAWDRETRILTLCHELFDHYYVLSRQKIVTERRADFDEREEAILP